MRVLVCGSRDWNDRDMIRAALSRLPSGTIVIEGEARGADLLARSVAEELGFEVVKFPADWTRYHRAAGPIRNQQMLVEGKPDYVIAFHDDIRTSKGTFDMVNRARGAGIRVMIISHHGESE